MKQSWEEKATLRPSGQIPELERFTTSLEAITPHKVIDFLQKDRGNQPVRDFVADKWDQVTDALTHYTGIKGRDEIEEISAITFEIAHFIRLEDVDGKVQLYKETWDKLRALSQFAQIAANGVPAGLKGILNAFAKDVAQMTQNIDPNAVAKNLPAGNPPPGFNPA